MNQSLQIALIFGFLEHRIIFSKINISYDPVKIEFEDFTF